MNRKRVLLHVGTPKTGTSYLQDVLFNNRPALRAAGINYPAHRFDAHFLASLDLMRLPWGGLEKEAVGAWERVAEETRNWSGTTIISHEVLAHASRPQVCRALESLGHPDTEVHVVLSVRDLVRQVPAEWQENIKHRRTTGYRQFLDELRDPARSGKIASWFWSVQEVPEILDRWAAELPPEHVHLVTVPPSGADSSLLWERFSRTFGLDAADLDLHAERVNPSMGVPETALVRRINRRINATVKPAHYRPLVRELLVHQTLAKRQRSPRLTLPPEEWEWARQLSEKWLADIRGRGIDVVGDLDDLLPHGEPPAFVDPDRARPRQMNRAAIDVIEALLEETVRLRETEDELREQVGELEEALRRSYLRPSYRIRERAVRRLEESDTGKGLMGTYRRLRGR